MLADQFVDFARRNLLAPAIDYFLDSSGNIQVTVCVEPTLVSCPQPSVGKRLVVVGRIVCVTPHHSRTSHHDLARVTRWKEVAFFVHDSDVGPTWNAGGTGFPHTRRQRVYRNLLCR